MRSLFSLKLSLTFLLCLGALALSISGLLAIELPATTTSLHLRNGDRITGVIASESTTEIIINSPTLGQITIPTAQVDHREQIPAPIAVPPAPTIVPAIAKPVITQPPPPKPKHWATDVQIGMNLRYSATDATDYLAAVHTTYTKGRMREALNYSFIYGKTGDILSANRMTASSKTDFDMGERWYLYNLAGAGYDKIRRIDSEYEIGPGVGVMVLNSLTNHFVWRSEVGFSFQEQFRNDYTDQVTYSARLAQLISWKLWEKLTSNTHFEFFPNLQNFGDYRLRLETTLSYPLLENISLNLIASDLYDTLPVFGITRNDFQIRSALGLRF